MPLRNDSNPEVISKSAAMAVAFTPAAYEHIVSLLPRPDSYAELHNRLEKGYPGVLRGDPEMLKVFEADLKAVTTAFTMIHGVAKVVAVKDPAILDILGLAHLHEKTASAAVSLGTPQGVKAVFDPTGPKDIKSGAAMVPPASSPTGDSLHPLQIAGGSW